MVGGKHAVCSMLIDRSHMQHGPRYGAEMSGTGGERKCMTKLGLRTMHEEQEHQQKDPPHPWGSHVPESTEEDEAKGVSEEGMKQEERLTVVGKYRAEARGCGK
eukprot:760272-Hanusia_phi.AAC.7